MWAKLRHGFAQQEPNDLFNDVWCLDTALLTLGIMREFGAQKRHKSEMSDDRNVDELLAPISDFGRLAKKCWRLYEANSNCI